MALRLRPDGSALQIMAHMDGTIGYVEAAGEIDLDGEKALRHVVEGMLAQGARSVIFDLRRVSFMDAGALKVLLGAKSHLVSHSGEVYVLVGQELPRRVIHAAHIQGAVKLCRSVDEALLDIARRCLLMTPTLQGPSNA